MSKIVTIEKLADRLHEARKPGRKIVFTNGCFDILHVGHVRYLAEAASAGDILVVGLNSDESVQLIKGAKRPIVQQDHRAEVLASIACVDYVVIFDEADPLTVIRTLRPDVLAKGADWTEENIIGAEFVKSNGGKIIRIPLIQDASTSRVIERILGKYDRPGST